MSESASASIEPAELQRLDALLARLQLSRYRDMILAQAAPCIALALDDPPEPRPEVWPQPPLGASLIGGAPDLPPSWAWPLRDDVRAGFLPATRARRRAAHTVEPAASARHAVPVLLHRCGGVLGSTGLGVAALGRPARGVAAHAAVGYTSPYDAAPVYVMAKDPGTRPWVPTGAVPSLAAT
jgi:hypothetical protein